MIIHTLFDKRLTILGLNSYELDTVFRQAGDNEFISVLSQVRQGSITKEVG